MIIEITGWPSGFKKVSFNNVLRVELKMSIAKAKSIVDEILDGEIVRLKYSKGLEEEIIKAKLEYKIIKK